MMLLGRHLALLTALLAPLDDAPRAAPPTTGPDPRWRVEYHKLDVDGDGWPDYVVLSSAPPAEEDATAVHDVLFLDGRGGTFRRRVIDRLRLPRTVCPSLEFHENPRTHRDDVYATVGTCGRARGDRKVFRVYVNTGSGFVGRARKQP